MRVNYSISQIQKFRNCKKAWEYCYKERLKPRATARPLYVGSTIHELIELRARGEDWKKHLETVVSDKFESLSTSNKAIIGEDFIETCYKIMTQYCEVYKDENLKYLLIEQPIEWQLGEEEYFYGIVDAVVEKEDGTQWLVEHKTFGSKMMSPDNTWINSQTALYIKVLNDKYGYHIKGVIWDMIKSEAPSAPNILKNGNFGKQYGTVTTYSFECAGYESIPEDIYNDIKDNYKNFVIRYETIVFKEVAESIWQDFVQSIKEIKATERCTRTLTKDCSFCSYKTLCQVELTGGDVEAVKTKEYISKFEELKKFQNRCATCEKCLNFAKSFNQQLDPEYCITLCKVFQKQK